MHRLRCDKFTCTDPAHTALTFHRPSALPRLALLTGAGLLAILVWDVSGGDLWMARLFAGEHGFPAQDHWLLTRVLHDGARLLAALLFIALVLGVVWPLGPLRGLPRQRRIWLVAAVAGGFLLPTLVKRLSATSCPWDLQPFGGAFEWVSHWQWTRVGQGPGHCFPAGHASAGFAWVAGYFAWAGGSRLARRWLVGAFIAGLILGLGQQVRGAHFMSHTLWTA